MDAVVRLLDLAQGTVQPADVFLLPLTRRQYFSTIEIKQIHAVVPANLQVIGIQVGMEYARLMKAMQFNAQALPEFLVARPIRDAIRE